MEEYLWLIDQSFCLPCPYFLPIRKKKKIEIGGTLQHAHLNEKFDAERQAFFLVDHTRFRMRTSLPLLDRAPYRH